MMMGEVTDAIAAFMLQEMSPMSQIDEYFDESIWTGKAVHVLIDLPLSDSQHAERKKLLARARQAFRIPRKRRERFDELNSVLQGADKRNVKRSKGSEPVTVSMLSGTYEPFCRIKSQ